MRRPMLILALVVIGTLACAATDRVEAIVAAPAYGMGFVIDGIRAAEQVHCRPGRRHHRVWPYDGCYPNRHRVPATPSPPPPPRQDGGFGSLHEW